MKVRDYLLESKIQSKDMNAIKKYIRKPPKRQETFVLMSLSNLYDKEERSIDIYPGKGNTIISFEYNLDFDELTFAIVELIDNMDAYDFKSGIERPTNTAWIEVIKK